MIDKLQASKSGNFFLLAGPCVIEGEQMAMDIAGHVSKLQKNWIYPMCLKAVTERQTALALILLQELEM